MESIGKNLKEARISKSLHLKTISEELKISEITLNDIECDNFPNYINKVYIIGHIRAYAKLLDLDDEVIINNFKKQELYNSPVLSNQISKPIQEKNNFFFKKSLSFASVIIITSSFYFLFIKPNDLQPSYAMTPEVPENLNFKLEETDMKISLSSNLNKNEIKNKREIVSMKISEEKILNNKDLNTNISASSALASLANTNDKYLNKIITLKFLDSTWIQLRNSDDKIIISKLMNQNDQYSFNSSENLFLTAGNAGNIIILLDGNVKGKAGKLGEVVDSLMIDNSFKN